MTNSRRPHSRGSPIQGLLCDVCLSFLRPHRWTSPLSFPTRTHSALLVDLLIPSWILIRLRLRLRSPRPHASSGISPPHLSALRATWLPSRRTALSFSHHRLVSAGRKLTSWPRGNDDHNRPRPSRATQRQNRRFKHANWSTTTIRQEYTPRGAHTKPASRYTQSRQFKGWNKATVTVDDGHDKWRFRGSGFSDEAARIKAAVLAVGIHAIRGHPWPLCFSNSSPIPGLCPRRTSRKIQIQHLLLTGPGSGISVILQYPDDESLCRRLRMLWVRQVPQGSESQSRITHAGNPKERMAVLPT